ncbi:ferrous iron transport protein A [Phycisphaerales bacterium]|nr:ferrous iron transport protein A [Phycisphaerales bacterium]RPG19528.1 MAG: ferrous iron transport protein A [Phycisphaera sp. TMED9]
MSLDPQTFTTASPSVETVSGPGSGTLTSRGSTSDDEKMRRPLTLCPSGCRATIHTDELDLDARAMLEAMGVEHGCEVEICKVGSPCILRVESTRFGVGREVAARITATVTTTLNGSPLPG